MSILITGNHGFIGCWLNIYLKEISDYKIFGIDNRCSYGERLIDLKKGSDNIVEKQFFNNVSDIDNLIKKL